MSLRSAAVRVASVGVLVATAALQAQRMPDAEPMHGFVRAPAGFVATPAPAALASLQGEIDPAVVAEAEAFRATHGDWRFYVDRRSGAIALAEGAGIPWLAAEERGDLRRLESHARALVAAYPSLLPFAAADLVLDHGRLAAARRAGAAVEPGFPPAARWRRGRRLPAGLPHLPRPAGSVRRHAPGGDAESP